MADQVPFDTGGDATSHQADDKNHSDSRDNKTLGLEQSSANLTNPFGVSWEFEESYVPILPTEPSQGSDDDKYGDVYLPSRNPRNQSSVLTTSSQHVDDDKYGDVYLPSRNPRNQSSVLTTSSQHVDDDEYGDLCLPPRSYHNQSSMLTTSSQHVDDDEYGDVYLPSHYHRNQSSMLTTSSQHVDDDQSDMKDSSSTDIVLGKPETSSLIVDVEPIGWHNRPPPKVYRRRGVFNLGRLLPVPIVETDSDASVYPPLLPGEYNLLDSLNGEDYKTEGWPDSIPKWLKNVPQPFEIEGAYLFGTMCVDIVVVGISEEYMKEQNCYRQWTTTEQPTARADIMAMCNSSLLMVDIVDLQEDWVYRRAERAMYAINLSFEMLEQQGPQPVYIEQLTSIWDKWMEAQNKALGTLLTGVSAVITSLVAETKRNDNAEELAVACKDASGHIRDSLRASFEARWEQSHEEFMKDVSKFDKSRLDKPSMMSSKFEQEVGYINRKLRPTFCTDSFLCVPMFRSRQIEVVYWEAGKPRTRPTHYLENGKKILGYDPNLKWSDIPRVAKPEPRRRPVTVFGNYW